MIILRFGFLGCFTTNREAVESVFFLSHPYQAACLIPYYIDKHVSKLKRQSPIKNWYSVQYQESINVFKSPFFFGDLFCLFILWAQFGRDVSFPICKSSKKGQGKKALCHYDEKEWVSSYMTENVGTFVFFHFLTLENYLLCFRRHHYLGKKGMLFEEFSINTGQLFASDILVPVF